MYISLVDLTVTATEIDEVVTCLVLDVEKTNAVVDPKLNKPFDTETESCLSS